jgi:hypothetical protein
MHACAPYNYYMYALEILTYLPRHWIASRATCVAASAAYRITPAQLITNHSIIMIKLYQGISKQTPCCITFVGHT